MKRMVDLKCPACDLELVDQFVGEDDAVRCPCGQTMEQIWWKRKAQRATCWDERDSVVIFEKPPGSYIDEKSRFSFPARNTKPCPPGWIKHVARSDREVAALERMTGTLNHDRHFDRGSGRGFDDYIRGEKVTH